MATVYSLSVNQIEALCQDKKCDCPNKYVTLLKFLQYWDKKGKVFTEGENKGVVVLQPNTEVQEAEQVRIVGNISQRDKPYQQKFLTRNDKKIIWKGHERIAASLGLFYGILPVGNQTYDMGAYELQSQNLIYVIPQSGNTESVFENLMNQSHEIDDNFWQQLTPATDVDTLMAEVSFKYKYTVPLDLDSKKVKYCFGKPLGDLLGNFFQNAGLANSPQVASKLFTCVDDLIALKESNQLENFFPSFNPDTVIENAQVLLDQIILAIGLNAADAEKYLEYGAIILPINQESFAKNDSFQKFPQTFVEISQQYYKFWKEYPQIMILNLTTILETDINTLKLNDDDQNFERDVQWVLRHMCMVPHSVEEFARMAVNRPDLLSITEYTDYSSYENYSNTFVDIKMQTLFKVIVKHFEDVTTQWGNQDKTKVFDTFKEFFNKLRDAYDEASNELNDDQEVLLAKQCMYSSYDLFNNVTGRKQKAEYTEAYAKIKSNLKEFAAEAGSQEDEKELLKLKDEFDASYQDVTDDNVEEKINELQKLQQKTETVLLGDKALNENDVNFFTDQVKVRKEDLEAHSEAGRNFIRAQQRQFVQTFEKFGIESLEDQIYIIARQNASRARIAIKQAIDRASEIKKGQLQELMIAKLAKEINYNSERTGKDGFDRFTDVIYVCEGLPNDSVKIDSSQSVLSSTSCLTMTRLGEEVHQELRKQEYWKMKEEKIGSHWTEQEDQVVPDYEFFTSPMSLAMQSTACFSEHFYREIVLIWCNEIEPKIFEVILNNIKILAMPFNKDMLCPFLQERIRKIAKKQRITDTDLENDLYKSVLKVENLQDVRNLLTNLINSKKYSMLKLYVFYLFAFASQIFALKIINCEYVTNDVLGDPGENRLSAFLSQFKQDLGKNAKNFPQTLLKLNMLGFGLNKSKIQGKNGMMLGAFVGLLSSGNSLSFVTSRTVDIEDDHNMLFQQWSPEFDDILTKTFRTEITQAINNNSSFDPSSLTIHRLLQLGPVMDKEGTNSRVNSDDMAMFSNIMFNGLSIDETRVSDGLDNEVQDFDTQQRQPNVASNVRKPLDALDLLNDSEKCTKTQFRCSAYPKVRSNFAFGTTSQDKRSGYADFKDKFVNGLWRQQCFRNIETDTNTWGRSNPVKVCGTHASLLDLILQNSYVDRQNGSNVSKLIAENPTRYRSVMNQQRHHCIWVRHWHDSAARLQVRVPPQTGLPAHASNQLMYVWGDPGAPQKSSSISSSNTAFGKTLGRRNKVQRQQRFGPQIDIVLKTLDNQKHDIPTGCCMESVNNCNLSEALDATNQNDQADDYKVKTDAFGNKLASEVARCQLEAELFKTKHLMFSTFRHLFNSKYSIESSGVGCRKALKDVTVYDIVHTSECDFSPFVEDILRNKLQEFGSVIFSDKLLDLKTMQAQAKKAWADSVKQELNAVNAVVDFGKLQKKAWSAGSNWENTKRFVNYLPFIVPFLVAYFKYNVGGTALTFAAVSSAVGVSKTFLSPSMSDETKYIFGLVIVLVNLIFQPLAGFLTSKVLDLPGASYIPSESTAFVWALCIIMYGLQIYATTEGFAAIRNCFLTWFVTSFQKLQTKLTNLTKATNDPGDNTSEIEQFTRQVMQSDLGLEDNQISRDVDVHFDISAIKSKFEKFFEFMTGSALPKDLTVDKLKEPMSLDPRKPMGVIINSLKQPNVGRFELSQQLKTAGLTGVSAAAVVNMLIRPSGANVAVGGLALYKLRDYLKTDKPKSQEARISGFLPSNKPSNGVSEDDKLKKFETKIEEFKNRLTSTNQVDEFEIYFRNPEDFFKRYKTLEKKQQVKLNEDITKSFEDSGLDFLQKAELTSILGSLL